MSKLSEVSADEAKERLYNTYMAAHDAYDSDNPEHGRHPSQDFNRWVNIAATGGTNSEKRIQSQDDDQPEITERGNAGKTPAMDAALEDARIRNSGHHDIAGQLALAAARRSNPAAVRGMARALGPAYNRLR